MRILLRSDIEILESSLQEDTPEFNPLWRYEVGQIVKEGNTLFECIKQSEKPNLESDFRQIGADNTMRAFDSAPNSLSTMPLGQDMRLKVRSAGCLYLTNFVCNTLEVRLYDTKGSLLKEEIVGKQEETDYRSYFFKRSIAKEGSYLFPHVGPAIYEVVLKNTAQETKTLAEAEGIRVYAFGGERVLKSDVPVSLGVFFCGELVELGTTLYKGALSVEDFSKVEVDEHTGLTKIKPGVYRKSYKFTILVLLENLDNILEILVRHKSIPSILELSDALECLRLFGLIKSVDVNFNDTKRAHIDLELQELT
ncbi:hypothetical protein [Helicobacter felis]|uniref:Uncharacterized protein n=1 Tax=Helicobacter felis (strain ATCC 49179 / CCUG 28539 / NCTC 12436 / CS1) TaxID=936155 RepID=E7AC37_HELFC|nr:hypothetical protein [Helicobacter felis]CBY82119.1 putative uncharacterized protein [Helicobacter felis ATCC 49179]